MTQRDREKYENEKKDLEVFLRVEQYHGWKIEKGEDPPDLIIIKETQKISVEHTEVFKTNGGRIKAHFDLVDMLIKEAEIIFNQEHDINLNVKFDFKYQIDVTKGKREEMIMQLVEFVFEKYNGTDVSKRKDFGVICRENLPYFLNEISIMNYPDLKTSFWFRENLILSGEIQTSDIYNLIERKNNRLKKTKYYENYDENWLLLVVKGEKWSEFSTYEPVGFKSDNLWKFDKIYLLSIFNNQVFDLI